MTESTARGKCGVCGGAYTIRGDGTLRAHKLMSPGMLGRGCLGSGTTPVVVETTTPAALGARDEVEAAARLVVTDAAPEALDRLRQALDRLDGVSP